MRPLSSMFHPNRSFRSPFPVKPIAIAVMSSGLAMGAMAQTNSLMLEEVTVTARKIEENLQTTPVAVSALTSADMELRGVQNAVDIGNYAPNVNLATGATFSGSSSAPTVFIRGLGQADFVNTADPAVGIYVDGVYLGRAVGGLMDILDLDRVEVLRGPQGTLFGRNNIGGAISLIGKKPDPDAGFAGHAAVTVGEDSLYQGQFSSNIPISDSAAARVSALYRKRDGFVKATQYDDLELGNDDSLSLRGSMRFYPTETLTVDLSVDYSTEDESPAPVVATFVGDLPSFGSFSPDGAVFNATTPGCETPEAAASSLNCFGPAHVSQNGFTNNSLWTDGYGNVVTPAQKMDLWGASLALAWDLDIGTIKSITSKRDMESSFFNDLDFTPFPLFHNENSQYDQDQFSQELQFSGSFLDDRLSLTTGVYYFEESSIQNVSINRFGGPPPIRPNPGGSFFQNSVRVVDNESLAVYGQATYDLTDTLHLTAGLRYTKEEKDFALALDRLDNNGTFLGPILGNLETTETVPLITLGWDMTDVVYGYFTYTEGFRSGGFPTRFTAGFPDEIDSFDPEFVQSYEIGTKMDLLDDRLRLNLAAFRTIYDDIQVAATPTTDLGENNTAIDNLGGAELTGLEAELLWNVHDNWRVDLNVGWLDDDITDIAGGELVSSGIFITTDNIMPYTPELNGTLGITYANMLASGAEFRARFDIRYVDEQFFRVENVPEAYEDSFTVSNMSLSYISAANWEVIFGVRNLGDSDHFSNRAYAEVVPNTAQGIAVRPRNAYLTFKYNWGD